MSRSGRLSRMGMCKHAKSDELSRVCFPISTGSDLTDKDATTFEICLFYLFRALRETRCDGAGGSKARQGMDDYCRFRVQILFDHQRSGIVLSFMFIVVTLLVSVTVE
eukprot:5520732-Pleurochrysis_carterae.AAC.2